jgi:hypothetical protein
VADDGDGFFRGIGDAFREGYDSEDAKNRQDTASLGEKIADGAVSGFVNTVVNPLSWIKSIFFH